jgi:hypothetical protein
MCISDASVQCVLYVQPDLRSRVQLHARVPRAMRLPEQIDTRSSPALIEK